MTGDDPERIRSRCMAGVARLDDDSLLVVDMLVQRMLAGREEYGRLDIGTDLRDWAAEGAEEAIDLAAYLAIGLLKRSTREP